MGIHLRTDPASVPAAHAMDISGSITYWAQWAPGKTAARFKDRSVTRAKPERDIGSAAWLRADGTSPGDRLAYPGPNCPELLELLRHTIFGAPAPGPQLAAQPIREQLHTALVGSTCVARRSNQDGERPLRTGKGRFSAAPSPGGDSPSVDMKGADDG